MGRRRITKTARTLAYPVTGVFFIPFAAEAGTSPGATTGRGLALPMTPPRRSPSSAPPRVLSRGPLREARSARPCSLSTDGQIVDVHPGPNISRPSQWGVEMADR